MAELTPALEAELQALRFERQYWHEHQACKILELARALEGNMRPGGIGAKAPRSVILRELREAVRSMLDALAGDFHQHCEGCSKQILPGDPVISSTEGAIHADCSGAGAYKVGDHIPMPAEQVEVAEGETYPGYIVVTAHVGKLWDDAGISGIVARASVVLASLGEAA
jgi:hypothetical protein